MKRLWRWVKRLFVKPKPVVRETPVMAEQRAADVFHDRENQGSPENPDWIYISQNLELDDNSEKLGTIGWYYGMFKKVESEIKKAAQMSNLPWWFIAGIDMREMSFVHNGHFANGDKIIGTGKKTYRIPRNLGPAKTWMESVKQVFDYKARTDSLFTSMIGPDMDFADACMAWEKYNGYGFRSKGEYSEYVVGFTNFHDETGRYVADRRYSYTSKVVRPGAAAFVLYLLKKGDVTKEELGLK